MRIQDRVRDVKSKKGVDDKSSRTLVYSEIKPLLSDITDVNLRKITFRAKKIYILFDGIGINRIQIIRSAISNLSDNQIQDIIPYSSELSTLFLLERCLFSGNFINLVLNSVGQNYP